MRFEWDMDKQKENSRKHGVSFHEACAVFSDPYMLSIYDSAHSDDEDRWITLGVSGRKLMVVVHTYRKSKGMESVRIISARKATAREAGQYSSRKGE